MSWPIVPPRRSGLALLECCALLTCGCELLAGIDDRSTAGSAAASTGVGVGGGAGASSATGPSTASGPASGGFGGVGGASGGATSCPDGYMHCDAAEPTACVSLNSRLHCGRCNHLCNGACLEAQCDESVSTEGLLLWLRADAGVIPTADGFVEWWMTEVPEGAAAWADGTARPRLGEINLRTALLFDGLDDFMELPTDDSFDGATMFIAFSPASSDPAVLLVLSSGGPETIARLHHQSGADVRYEVSPPPPGFIVSADWYANGPAIIGVKHAPSGDVTMWHEATTQPQTSVSMGGAPPLILGNVFYSRIGAELDGSGAFNGAIAEIMIYGGPLTSTDAVDSYLRGKYLAR